MTKKIVIFVVVLMSIMMTSCGLFTAKDIYDEASKYINIKMNNDNTKAVDSVAIHFDPVYFKLKKCDSIADKEYEIVKDGYRIWILETRDTFRVEVDRIDTLGYIYKR